MKKLIKRFKEKVYLGLFQKFQSKEDRHGTEMRAALTVNAIRNLDDKQRFRLAYDLVERIPFHYKVIIFFYLKKQINQTEKRNLGYRPD